MLIFYLFWLFHATFLLSKILFRPMLGWLQLQWFVYVNKTPKETVKKARLQVAENKKKAIDELMNEFIADINTITKTGKPGENIKNRVFSHFNDWKIYETLTEIACMVIGFFTEYRSLFFIYFATRVFGMVFTIKVKDPFTQARSKTFFSFLQILILANILYHYFLTTNG